MMVVGLLEVEETDLGKSRLIYTQAMKRQYCNRGHAIRRCLDFQRAERGNGERMMEGCVIVVSCSPWGHSHSSWPWVRCAGQSVVMGRNQDGIE